jgi:Protein of unknown function (DUF1566)
MVSKTVLFFIPAILAGVSHTPDPESFGYAIVDTGQQLCYDIYGQNISCSVSGQDASYDGNLPSYTDNGDGTVTDNVTGLVWQLTPDSNSDGTINISDKMTQSNAVNFCGSLSFGGTNNWRLPDIKTLYSLIDFRGEDVSASNVGAIPFIDTDYFDFGYGDTNAGERLIDAQWATTSIYVSTVMTGQQAMFGVNLADGRIKGYPTQNKLYYVQCVSGEEQYGENSFSSSGQNTVLDSETGLMWQESDSGSGLDWDSSISYCENTATDGYTDWRLPNAKELHSIVDYTRSPNTTGTAALDPLFNATGFVNEAGQSDYGFYWSSTTHKSSNGMNGTAVYISFGRALGYMNSQWMDVHGAGAQRSDPKNEMLTGNLEPGYQLAPTAQGGWAIVHGPQGDVVRSLNYVRCVRNAN